MRRSGPTWLTVYCSDYKCAHSIVIDASRSGDDVHLSDLEPRFTCRVCGHRGAEIRPFVRPRAHGGRLGPGMVMLCGPRQPGSAPVLEAKGPSGTTLRPFQAEVSYFGKRDTASTHFAYSGS
jgi:hypothetical protein